MNTQTEKLESFSEIMSEMFRKLNTGNENVNLGDLISLKDAHERELSIKENKI